MSLVSEAHRRANGETVADESPNKSISVSWWLFSIICALALGSAATFWYDSTDFVLETNIASAQSSIPVLDDTLVSLKSERLASEEPTNASDPESSASVLALYERARVERESLSQRSANSVLPSSSNPDEADEPEKSRPSPAIVPPSRSSSIDEEQLLAGAERLLANSQRDTVLSSALPTLETLSENDRNRVPTLLYSAHDYQARGESKVMINREWWSEGQSISGIKVVEIREKSTVLETQDGIRFLQPALSSWVNL